jgi:hypothetical protein
MIDSRLYDQRDEYFDDIQQGDLVYYRDHRGRVAEGFARARTVGGWQVRGSLEKDSPAIVHEEDNYLGHLNAKTLRGLAA